MKTDCIKFLLVIVAIISLGCQNQTRPKNELKLLGTWRLSSKEPIASNSRDVLSGRSNKTEVLSLFADSSYTRFFDSGELHTGKWRLSKDQDFITFIESGELHTSFQIGENDFGKQTFIFENPALNKRFEFIKEFEPLFNFRNDPLYYHNNKWRVKPSSGLSDEEIRAKVADYVRHVALILDAAKDRKQDVISFEFSRGPIKIYSGGIGVQQFSAVPLQWKNCFYNENEAYKAYQTYASAVERTDYRLASSGDWLKDDSRILDAVHAVLTRP